MLACDLDVADVLLPHLANVLLEQRSMKEIICRNLGL
jgi:hypothetical protein